MISVGAGGEEHLRLEDEAVADHPDVGTVAENLAEPAEEVGAIARQLLDALGERHVEPAPEIGDLGLALLVAILGGLDRGLERRDLAPERRDLLVEQLDLGERLLADLLLGVEILAERGDAVPG